MQMAMQRHERVSIYRSNHSSRIFKLTMTLTGLGRGLQVGLPCPMTANAGEADIEARGTCSIKASNTDGHPFIVTSLTRLMCVSQEWVSPKTQFKGLQQGSARLVVSRMTSSAKICMMT